MKGPICPPRLYQPDSLKDLTLQVGGFFPYMQSKFGVIGEFSGHHGSVSGTGFRIDLAPVARPGGALPRGVVLTPAQRIRLRRMQRACWEELFRWGTKHDHVIKLGYTLGYQFSFRDLVLSRGRVVDLATAQGVVTDSRIPAEVRFCMAALYCIEDTPGQEQVSELWKSRDAFRGQLAFMLGELWRGALCTEERKRWFRKLCHKGFTQLACRVWRDSGSALTVEANEFLTLYLNGYLTWDKSVLMFIEDRMGIDAAFVAKNLVVSLHRYANRPALFHGAYSLVTTWVDPATIRLAFIRRVDPQAILCAALAFNLPFLKAAVSYVGMEMLLRCHVDIVAMCRMRNITSLTSVCDAICGAVPEAWANILAQDNYALFCAATAPPRPCPLCLDLLLETCPDHMLRSMVVAAGGVRAFRPVFRDLCLRNCVRAVSTLAHYLPGDIWEAVITANAFADMVEAARMGSVGILEVVRSTVDPYVWTLLVGTLRAGSAAAFWSYPVDVAHYLYFEHVMRAMLEADWQEEEQRRADWTEQQNRQSHWSHDQAGTSYARQTDATPTTSTTAQSSDNCSLTVRSPMTVALPNNYAQFNTGTDSGTGVGSLDRNGTSALYNGTM